MVRSSLANKKPASRDILNLVNTASRQGLLDKVASRFENNQGFSIATLNLDHVVKLKQDISFCAAYQKQTYVVADGNPIVWLSRLRRKPVELVPGSELIDPLCELAIQYGAPVALFGTTPQSLERASCVLLQRYPNLKIVCELSPPLGFDPSGEAATHHAQKIAESEAQLCFIALGAPKQEQFSVHALQHAPSCGFVSIGAGLDFISGTQTRAPVLVRKLALEWAWRLLRHPGRLAGRYAMCFAVLPDLFWAAYKERHLS